MTKEHIYSDWLAEHNILPTADFHYVTKNEVKFIEGKRVLIGVPKKIPGAIHSKKYRVVCGTCNGGWLGTIDQQAMEPAIPLIQGKALDLSTDFQIRLARWFTKATIVAERKNPKKAWIKQIDRTYLKNELVPPNHWYIGIGYFDWGPEPPNTNYNRNWNAVYTKDISGAIESEFHTQSTGHVLGNLYAQVDIGTRPWKCPNGRALLPQSRPNLAPTLQPNPVATSGALSRQCRSLR